MDLVLINGKRTDKNRTEAEVRASRDRRFAGEHFEAMERRLFDESRARFDLAISAARTAMEDANLSPASIELLDNLNSDLVGDTWAVEKPWGVA